MSSEYADLENLRKKLHGHTILCGQTSNFPWDISHPLHQETSGIYLANPEDEQGRFFVEDIHLFVAPKQPITGNFEVELERLREELAKLTGLTSGRKFSTTQSDLILGNLTNIEPVDHVNLEELESIPGKLTDAVASGRELFDREVIRIYPNKALATSVFIYERSFISRKILRDSIWETFRSRIPFNSLHYINQNPLVMTRIPIRS